MGKIRILPDQVVNLIAAGEVVERPASVVKELVENALDAGARSIEIRIEDGGRRLVEVLDDGEGMDGDDAVAALERHATSKLASGKALDAIETLGFRGEALPSIAAVSQFALATGTGHGGTRVRVEGGKILASEPAPHPRGTTVTVRNLFFNTPARQRFLRAASTETGHVTEIVAALALSRHDIGFRLVQGSRRILDLPPVLALPERLAQIEGAEVARGAIRLDRESGEARVNGFVAVTGGTGSSRGARWLIVNGRVVRDRILARAVNRAIEESLPIGTPCWCLALLTLPAGQVDVNVHPAKAEVRFAAPGSVHDLLRDAIRGALASAHPPRTGPAPEAAHPHGPVEDRLDSRALAPDGRRDGIAEAAAAYLGRAERGGEAAWPARPGSTGAIADPLLPAGEPVVLGHYRTGYILAQDGEGLLLVDQHAAHERILFEEMTSAAGTSGGETQALLFPRPVSLPAALRGQADDLVSDLAALGFETEVFGEEGLIVRAVPAPLAGADPEALVLEVLASRDPERGAAATVEARRRRMLATAACHAAVKVPQPLTREKMDYLVRRLFECGGGMLCPHGRPTVLRWSHRDIERGFLRP